MPSWPAQGEKHDRNHADHPGPGSAPGHTLKDLRGPRFRRLFRGVYLPAGEPVTLIQRARAALLVAPPGAYASHHTAARLWGAVPPDTAETHISIPGKGTRSVRDGIAAHRAETTFPPTARRGVPLSAPVAVFLEVATLHVDLVALVVLGDSLVRRARITPEALVVATAGWSGRGPGWHGGRPPWSGPASTRRWRAGSG